MNSPVEHQSFDDPALKRVCRHAWSAEKCPLDLVARLKVAAKKAPLQTVQPVQSNQPIPMWYSGGFGIAAAAMVLVAFGLVARPFARPADANAATTAALVDPQNKITQSMVAMHDKCCASKTGKHQIASVPKEHLLATGGALGQRLGQPVLATALPERGWSFEGGAVCPVTDNNAQKINAAHLIYRSGPDSVSLFSMPRAVSPCRKFRGPYEGTFVETKPDGQQVLHPIAGFVDSRGAYCLVGSGSPQLTLIRLAAMRDRIQSTVVTCPLPPEYRPALVHAELLQPLP